MKKSLSVLLSAAIAFGAFASVASAATPTTALEKFNALKAAGIFSGVGASQDPALDSKMTRAELARILDLLKGLDVDTKPTTQSFSDVKSSHWAFEEIEAAKAAGLVVGVGGGKFDPNGNVTVQQIAVAAANVLGLKPVAGATVAGADSWAAGYIQVLLDNGITLPTTYKAAATREILVTATYAVYDKIAVPAAVEVASVKAVGAKKVEVTFNKAVDTSKAAITIKKGSIAVNQASAASFSDDKKVATLNLATKLTAGDYTISVSGLTDTAITKTLTAEDEKVAKVEFLSLNAPVDRNSNTTVYADFKISNQYGENITSQGGLTFTVGKGTATPDYSTGKLAITSSAGFTKDEKIAVSALNPATNTFVSGVLVVADAARVSEVSFTKLYNADAKTPVAGTGVSDLFYLVVDAKDQYGASVTNLAYLDSDLVVTNNNPSAVPQIVPAVNHFKSVTIDGTATTAYELPTGNFVAGTSKFTAVSKTTGKLASFDVAVKDAVKSDVITLSQPELAVANEKVVIPFSAVDQFGAALTDKDVLNTATISASSTAGSHKISFVRDYVKNVTNLVLDLSDTTGSNHALTTEGNVAISILTGTNKFTTLNVAVKKPAEATVIAGTKDFNKNYAVDGLDTLDPADIIVNDQYGREFTNYTLGTSNGNYKITVETSDAGKVQLFGSNGVTGTTLTGTVYGFDNASDAVDLKGIAKGSSTITLNLWKVGTSTVDPVASSTYTFTSKVVDKADVVSYEIADIGTIADRALVTGTTTDHDKSVVVNGVLADGSKVTVPTGWFQLKVIGDHVSLSGTKLVSSSLSNGSDYATDKDTRDITVTAVVYGAEQQYVLTKTATLSKAAIAVNKLELTSVTGKVTKESDGVVSVSTSELVGQSLSQLVANAVKATDQYGVELATEPAYTIYDSNYNKVGSTVKTYGSLAAGDSFYVTAVAPNGKTINFKVIVK